MSDSDVKIRGLEELMRQYQEFPDKLQRRTMRAALTAAARVLRDAAKNLVPFRSGRLWKSIRVTRFKMNANTAKIAMVAGGKEIRGRPVFYAHFIEFGISAHEIKAVSAKALAIGGKFFESVSHPGFGAKPFMRAAFDIAAFEAINAFVRVIREAVTKQGMNPAEVLISAEPDDVD
jgi:HK97 gp10 family phage protein